LETNPMKALTRKQLLESKLPVAAGGIVLAAAVLFWGGKSLWSSAEASKLPAKSGGHGDNGHDDPHEEGVIHLAAERQKAAGIKLGNVERSAAS
jgi:hypothetical protein